MRLNFLLLFAFLFSTSSLIAMDQEKDWQEPKIPLKKAVAFKSIGAFVEHMKRDIWNERYSSVTLVEDPTFFYPPACRAVADLCNNINKLKILAVKISAGTFGQKDLLSLFFQYCFAKNPRIQIQFYGRRRVERFLPGPDYIEEWEQTQKTLYGDKINFEPFTVDQEVEWPEKAINKSVNPIENFIEELFYPMRKFFDFFASLVPLPNESDGKGVFYPLGSDLFSEIIKCCDAASAYRLSLTSKAVSTLFDRPDIRQSLFNRPRSFETIQEMSQHIRKNKSDLHYSSVTFLDEWPTYYENDFYENYGDVACLCHKINQLTILTNTRFENQGIIEKDPLEDFFKQCFDQNPQIYIIFYEKGFVAQKEKQQYKTKYGDQIKFEPLLNIFPVLNPRPPIPFLQDHV